MIKPLPHSYALETAIKIRETIEAKQECENRSDK